MIPILFASTETAFTSQGLGRLLDARKCEVTEERNGIYELVMEYPVSGALFSKIQPGCYIFATHDDSGTPQAFQIYKTAAPIEGWMQINAWHISYALNNIVVAPFTASTCSAAISGVKTNSMNTNPFTFWTDKSVTADFKLDVPASARSILGGTAGSLLDVYGAGEYEFDMFTVKLHAHRGANNGVTIRYGKNLKQLDYELDASNIYNAVVPYWTSESATVYLDHPVVRTGETAKNTIPLDLSGEFDTQPTTAQLEAKAQTIINASGNYQVKDNIKIDFVQLWQTEEYKIYSGLERVKLCDTVTVYYEKFGINATAKCIRTVYNTLLDRYSEIELGEPKTTLAQQIQEDTSDAIMPAVSGAASTANAALSEAAGLNTGYDEVLYSDDITGSVTSDATLASITVTDPGIYLVIAEGRVGRSGYAEADRPNIQQSVLLEQLRGNVIINMTRNFNNMTQTFGINCNAMFNCEAGDVIALFVQQRSTSVTVTSQTAHLSYSIIKLR